MSSKASVVIGVTPSSGHVNPMTAIARGLIALGYKVTMVTAPAYRDKIEQAGASFIPTFRKADFDSPEGREILMKGRSLEPGEAQRLWSFREFFIGAIPDQFEALQNAIGSASKSAPVVCLSESWFCGAIPSMLGAGLRPIAHLGVGISPIVLSSIDTAPFGPGLPPDSSPQGRERNIKMNKEVEAALQGPQERLLEILEQLKAPKTDVFFMNATTLLAERYIQMCIPGLEYPRSDAPDTIRFAGGIPISLHETATEHPSWWDDVVKNPEKKRIVMVSQGTVRPDTKELIIPTMDALKDHSDVLVVALLGVSEDPLSHSGLPPDTVIPANARVVNYMPYDDILPHCDLFVTNGGYGGFQHSVGRGVPLIMAGESQDKLDNGMRAEWAGVGLQLRTYRPTTEALRTAIDEVLRDPKYKNKTMEFAAQMAKSDPIQCIADNIEELVAQKQRS